MIGITPTAICHRNILQSVLCHRIIAAGYGHELTSLQDMAAQIFAHKLLRKVTQGRLGVQSRSEVGRIVSEAIWLISPGFADRFVGCEAAQGLEPFGEVDRRPGRRRGDPLAGSVFVVIAPDGGFLEGAVHPFDLAVGPRMVGLGESDGRCRVRGKLDRTCADR